MRLSAPALSSFGFAAGLALWSSLQTGVGLDYKADAQSAVDALASGHIGRALDVPPLMGPVSIVLRAATVAFVNLFGADPLDRYRAGCFVCLLGVAVLAAVVGGELARRRRPLLVRFGVIALLMLAGPTLSALKFGHPEEPLMGALAAGAVISAGRGRMPLAIALFALAVATKPTAILAAAPLVVLWPDWRRSVRELWAPLLVLALVLSAGALTVRSRVLGAFQTGRDVRFASVWWTFAERQQIRVFDGVSERTVQVRHAPPVLGRFGHLALTLLVIPAAFLHARFGRKTVRDALGLLALLMLMRCALDPVSIIYYHVPFMIALVCWEAFSSVRLPLLGISALMGLWLTLDWLPRTQSPQAANAAYLVIAALLGARLLVNLYGHRLRPRRDPLPAPVSG